MSGTIRYSILNPNGNITALVVSPVQPDRQPAAAGKIMELHPNVEQVGFVRFHGNSPESRGIHVSLRMAGGEFCGNASLSAAALYLSEYPAASGLPDDQALSESSEEKTVILGVSGYSGTVEAQLLPDGPNRFSGTVSMPPTLGISRREFAFDAMRDLLPLVRMEGISHIMIGPESSFYALKDRREAAGQAVRNWCSALRADCLGLMFLKPCSDYIYDLTPLVYVPGSGTLFWENSCASGSAAAAMYLADASGQRVSCVFREPGGQLSAESDPQAGQTLLCGSVELDNVSIRETALS